MATLLTLVFFLSVKLLLIQAAYQYDDSRRTGQFFPDQINQMSNNEYPQVQPFRNDKQFRNTNTRYYDANHNLNIGNGYNKNNVVIIDESSPRHFDRGNIKPNGIGKKSNIHKPRSETDGIDSRYGNRNLLQYPEKNNMDRTFTTYNKIGHGPENRNRVFINGEPVYTNSDPTRESNGNRRSEFRNDKQFRNTNTRYYDTNENVNIGNGYNKKNVVVIDERNPRNFDGGNVQSKPIPNGQQNNPNIYKPRTIDSTDNRYGNERELQHPNTNQGPINDLNNRRRNFFENPQFRDSSPGYHDDSEIVSIGNGHDRTNVVILDQSSRRNFQESTERAFLQPKYGIPNTNQRPRYVPNSRNINNIGNGQGNSNFVIIRDTADGLGRTVTTFPNGFPANSQVFVDKNPTYDNQRHNYPNTNNNNYGNYNRQNLNPPNSRNTYGNRETSNMDGTFTTYNKIGHGPENQNRVFINGELVNSNSDTTVLTRENNRRSDIFSIGGYSEDLKVLPLKKSK